MQTQPCTDGDVYPVPLDQRFYIRDLSQLRDELERLGADVPLVPEGDGLGRPLACRAAGLALPNRWIARLAVGHDAAPDGSPSALTCRRYTRPAAGGFGLICSEPVTVTPSAGHARGHLCLTLDTLPGFIALTERMRAAAEGSGQARPVLLLGLTLPGREATLDAAASGGAWGAAARLALDAGFEGVHIDSPAGARVDGEVLGRLVEAVRCACPAALVAVRLCVFDPRREPLGFGASASDSRAFDPTEPTALLARLAGVGVGLFELTTCHPALRAAPGSEADVPVPPDGFPHEHPLSALARRARIVGILRQAVPDVPVAMEGPDGLRQFLPIVAAGLIRDGGTDAVSLGRFALAYPDVPADWARNRQLDPYRCCIQCGACDRLRAAGVPAGCVIHDGETYGPGLRHSRRTAPERLRAEAGRCLHCFPAPCSRAMPGAPDIPSIMRAVARGDRARAGRLLRQHLVVPEMSLALAPYSASGEGACVLGALADRPIAIRDVLLDAAVASRVDAAQTADVSGGGVGGARASRRITIVGAGPAGLAAAAVLLDYGYGVTLIDRAARPGGVPELLIPAARYGGAQGEVEALFKAARASGRLGERYGTLVGRDVTLPSLRRDCDALLLATGLWADARAIAGDGDGLYGGLAFLERIKSGALVPPRGAAAVLAGGDCAMDAATVLEAHGATPLTIVYAGSRAAMHWCMEERWFTRPGIHLQTLCRPLAVERDAAGRVTGLRTVRMAPARDGVVDPLPGSEATLAVTCVVDASGLAPEGDWASSIDEPGGIFAAGALTNGGASIAQCVAEGMQAAERMHAYLMEDA